MTRVEDEVQRAFHLVVAVHVQQIRDQGIVNLDFKYRGTGLSDITVNSQGTDTESGR